MHRKKRLVVRLLSIAGGLVAGFSLFSAYVILRSEQAALLYEREISVRTVVPQILSYPEERRAALAAAAGFDLTYPATSSPENRRLEQTLTWYGKAPKRLYLTGNYEGSSWSASIDLGAERRVLDKSAELFVFYLLLNGLLLILVSGLWITRTIVRPLGLLASTMERVRGEFAGFRQLPVTRRDEIGSLFRSFNELMIRLQAAEASNKKSMAKLEKAYRELHAAQEQLIRSEKLASLGRLSSGIAHEIGNPLSAVKGYLSLARNMGAGEDVERTELIERAENEASRIDRIIRGLLDFARPRRASEQSLRTVSEVLLEVVDTLRPQRMFADITWDIQPGQQDVLVETAGGRLEQVFINLCINAADAMEGKGTLTLKTEQSTPDRIRLYVSDTGPGIAPEDQGDIFEPFFTTKPSNKGTGLGLAISYQIITALGGTIWCEAALGEGATFGIELPVTL